MNHLFFEQLKLRLLCLYKDGRCEFDQYVHSAQGELLQKCMAEEKQPWKVE